MKLFNRARSCHEVGVCQRSGAACRTVCHLVEVWEGEPPIGYEAARPDNVHMLHPKTGAAFEAKLPLPGTEWDWIQRLGKHIVTYFMAILLALALVGWVLIALHEWRGCTGDGWLAHLCWAIYDLRG